MKKEPEQNIVGISFLRGHKPHRIMITLAEEIPSMGYSPKVLRKILKKFETPIDLSKT